MQRDVFDVKAFLDIYNNMYLQKYKSVIYFYLLL